MAATEPSDTDHRAHLLERSMHRVLDQRDRGQRQANGDALEGGYGKWWLRIRGTHVLLAMVVVCAFGFVAYQVYTHDHDQKESMGRIERAVQESNEIQQAQLWVLAQPESERAKLNLSRPKKITEMQR